MTKQTTIVVTGALRVKDIYHTPSYLNLCQRRVIDGPVNVLKFRTLYLYFFGLNFTSYMYVALS